MMGMWTERIAVEGPYDFDKVLDRLAIDPLQAVDLENRAVKVPLYINDSPHVVTIQALGTVDEPIFIIEGKDTEAKGRLLSRIYEIFHWHKPMGSIQEHFQSTALESIFDIHRGTAILLDYDLFGNLAKSIIHQQLNLKFAYVLTQRFVETYGKKLEGAWFYPRPEVLAQLTVEELRELQFSGRKAEYVIGLATEITEGRLDLESLRDKSDAEIIAELTRVRGIGKWTAESFLLFGLGRPNIFPKADIGIQNALKQLMEMQEKPTMEEMAAYSKEWEPYLSYASLYLWRSIEKRSEKSK